MYSPSQLLSEAVLTADNLIMTAYGYASAFFMSFSVVRLMVVASLLPLYAAKVLLSVVPSIVRNLPRILTAGGRNRLVQLTDDYRHEDRSRSESQFLGSYVFDESAVFRVQRSEKAWMHDMPWSNQTEEFNVCGVTVRYVHLKPNANGTSDEQDGSERPVVLLHGNPSWSFMWRDVIPKLVDQGHEVYALDWIGHGRSDKILRPELINFELHMRTLIDFYNHVGLRDSILVAHDWGGCVALCTMPRLAPSSCAGLFLLNSFLPPRLSDLSPHYYLLYAIWFLSMGLMRSSMPESAVMRFMAPQISAADVEGYGAPYRNVPAQAKSSLFRFSHIAPGIPRFILNEARQTSGWKIIEGLCGPERFSNINAQADLCRLDDQVREFWRRDDSAKAALKTAVVFGQDDPLLKDFKNVLVHSIHPRHMVAWSANGVWLENAGHYPVEERPKDVALLIAKFASTRI